MKPSRSLIYTVLLVLCLAPGALLAQTADCPQLVQTALQAAGDACESTGRNQACYGNVQMVVTPQAGVDDFTFSAVGDVVNVGDIQSLTLSGMNIEDDEWGVAVLRVQANMPDTLPGQNVTFVLFGDVEIENAVAPSDPLPTLEVSAAGALNVRLRPVDGTVVNSLEAGETAVADGRLEDGSWVRIQLIEGGRGWVSTDFLADSGDLTSLTVVDPSEPVFGPMQAFYFRSGIGDAGCEQAPDSGILIQTPEGAGRVNLTVNGVDVELGSTAYIRSRPENEIGISVLEGMGIVEASGQRQYVPAGTWVRVPMSDDGHEPAGVATTPVGYNDARMQTLPVSLLDIPIEIMPSLSPEAVQDVLSGGD